MKLKQTTVDRYHPLDYSVPVTVEAEYYCPYCNELATGMILVKDPEILENLFFEYVNCCFCNKKAEVVFAPSSKAKPFM